MIGLGKKSDVKEVKEFVSQYLSYGFNLIKFNGFELKTNSTGSVSLLCHIEGKPQKNGFIGFEYESGLFAKGLIGKVQLGFAFQKEDPSKMVNSLTVIATEMGFSDEQMKTIKKETLEEFLSEFASFIKDKYVWVMLKAREYENKKGYTVVIADALWDEYLGKDESNISLFQLYCKAETFMQSIVKNEDGIIIELTGVNQSGKKIGAKQTRKFDKTSKYHYVAVEKSNTEVADDDELMEEIETDAF